MYLSKVQVNNYKSHLCSAALELTPGFNLITGQNNAGKTALLEALSLTFGSKPHRSLKTMPAVTFTAGLEIVGRCLLYVKA